MKKTRLALFTVICLWLALSVGAKASFYAASAQNQGIVEYSDNIDSWYFLYGYATPVVSASFAPWWAGQYTITLDFDTNIPKGYYNVGTLNMDGDAYVIIL